MFFIQSPIKLVLSVASCTWITLILENPDLYMPFQAVIFLFYNSFLQKLVCEENIHYIFVFTLMQ